MGGGSASRASPARAARSGSRSRMPRRRAAPASRAARARGPAGADRRRQRDQPRDPRARSSRRGGSRRRGRRRRGRRSTRVRGAEPAGAPYDLDPARPPHARRWTASSVARDARRARGPRVILLSSGRAPTRGGAGRRRDADQAGPPVAPVRRARHDDGGRPARAAAAPAPRGRRGRARARRRADPAGRGQPDQPAPSRSTCCAGSATASSVAGNGARGRRRAAARGVRRGADGLPDAGDGRLRGDAPRSARARATARRTPIIAHDRARDGGDRERCLAAGMDDYLTQAAARRDARRGARDAGSTRPGRP